MKRIEHMNNVKEMLCEADLNGFEEGLPKDKRKNVD